MEAVRKSTDPCRAGIASVPDTPAPYCIIRRLHAVFPSGSWRRPMRRLLEIASTGLAAVPLHPLRSLVSVVALVVVLLPYLVGLGLSKGLQAEAEASVGFGADLYVTGSRFGRPAPLPLSAVSAVRALDGVIEVVPRIVGEVLLGKERLHAVLVGVPTER